MGLGLRVESFIQSFVLFGRAVRAPYTRSLHEHLFSSLQGHFDVVSDVDTVSVLFA